MTTISEIKSNNSHYTTAPDQKQKANRLTTLSKGAITGAESTVAQSKSFSKKRVNLLHAVSNGPTQKASSETEELPAIQAELEILLERTVTWQELVNCNKKRPLSDPIEDLKDKPLDQLINWYYTRNLEAPITPLDIELFPWKAYLNHINNTKNLPVEQAQLKTILDRPVRWWELINCNKGRPLNCQIPYADLKEYVKGEPTLTQFINWDYRSDLEDPIEARDINSFPWRECLNRVNQTVDQNLPVDEAQLVKLLKRPVKWTELINCNKEKWLNAQITSNDYVEFVESMNEKHTTDELINWYMERDLACPITDSFRNKYPWRKFVNFFNKTFHKNLPVDKAQLEKLLKRPVKWSELVNCNNGHCLDIRPAYDDFLAHTNKKPTRPQFLNWFAQCDLDRPFSPEDTAAYPWRRLIEFVRKAEDKNSPVKAEALKRFFLKPIITWSDLINCNNQKNLSEVPSLAQFYEYYQSCNNGNLPKIEVEMAWFMDLSIEKTIEPDDFDTHPWKHHINLRNGNSDPVSKEELQKILGREVTLSELENCNQGNALSATE